MIIWRRKKIEFWMDETRIKTENWIIRRQKKNKVKIKIKIKDSLTKRNVTEHLTYKRNHEIKLRILKPCTTYPRIVRTAVCSRIRACDKGEESGVSCLSLNTPTMCTMIPWGILNPEDILCGKDCSQK